MPKLKPRQLPKEFLALNKKMSEAKSRYDMLAEEYREAVDELARAGWNTAYVSAVSPFAYPTLRKWMLEAANGSVDDTGR